MISYFRKLNKKKFIIITLLTVVVAACFLIIPQPAWASKVGSATATILGWIILHIIGLLGKLLTVIIRLLVTVAQYNDFINSPAVSKGWILIRDICNMFFIVVLLAIAFCTVLKIERYSYKRLLGSLLLAAVLVNFSKLICGVLIDIAQIIMLTFVNAFKEAAEGNFAEMLGLTKIMELRKTTGTEDIKNTEVIGALILGLIMTIVALVVVSIITIILIFRIIIIWFLVLLSPLIFVAGVLPQTQRYSSMWWEKFSHQLIVGPALAFLLWLSLAVVQDPATGGENMYQTMVDPDSEAAQKLAGELQVEGEVPGGLAAAVTQTGKPQYVLNFVIGIAMLIGSLMVAQQLGVAGSSLAGKAVNKMQSMASGAVRAPFKGLKLAGVQAVKEIQARTAIPLTKERWGDIRENARFRLEERRRKQYAEKAKTALIVPEEWEQLLSIKAFPILGRAAQRLFKKGESLRNEAGKDKDKLNDLEETQGQKMSQSDKNQLDKDITRVDKDSREADRVSKNFTTYGTVDLNTFDSFLSALRTEKVQLETDGKLLTAAGKPKEAQSKLAEANELDKLIDHLDVNKQLAKDADKSFVATGKIDKNMRQDYESRFKDWSGENKKNIKERAKELDKREINILWSESDRQEVSNQLSNLEAGVSSFKIDPGAKKELAAGINDLLKEAQKPFNQISPEERRDMADKMRGIQKKISELYKNKKIGTDENDKFGKMAKVAKLKLSKEVLSDSEMTSMTKQREDLRKKIGDNEARAEILRPTVMTPEERGALYAAANRNYEKVKGEEDPDVLSALYKKAELDKDIGLAMAVMMKLNSNLDINELHGALDLPQNFKGMSGLVKRLNKNLKLPLQQAYSFINDLCQENKHKGAFRFTGGVIRDSKTGLYRDATEEEHNQMAMTESGKVDREKLYRSGWWGSLVGKHTDPTTGQRVPTFDFTTGNIVKRDLDIIGTEIRKGRLQAELERNMSHKNIIDGLTAMRKTLSAAETTKLDAILNHLKIAQSKYW